MFMLRTFFTMAVIASVLLSAGLAGATSVSNTTTGTTLFFDDYEGVTVTGTDDDPENGTNPGSWKVFEPEPEEVRVLSNGTTPSPGAFQGTQYLRHARPQGGQTNARMTFPIQNTVGDVIHWESMVYVPSSQGTEQDFLTSFYGGWNGSGTAANIHLLPAASGDMKRFAGAIFDTDLDFALDQWQKWQIDYAIGQPDFTLTLGPNSNKVPLRIPITAAGFGEFRLGSEPGGAMFFDAVPEPSTFALVALGTMIGAAFVTCRRRSQV